MSDRPAPQLQGSCSRTSMARKCLGSGLVQRHCDQRDRTGSVIAMPRPATKAELLERMEAGLAALMNEIESLTPEQFTRPGACDHWSAKDILAHLDAWHELFLRWEEAGTRGEKPDMPAPGYTWKQTPSLNDAIWERTRDDDPDDVRHQFAASYARMQEVIDSYDGDVLFEKRRFPWTGSTSIGSYAVSATSSHYEWATKLLRVFRKSLQ